MAFRLSTKVRNDMLGKKAECNNLVYSAAGIALVNAGAGDLDSITGAGLLGDFHVGDMITVSGADDPDDDGSYEIQSVTAGVIEIPSESFTSGQAAANPIILGSSRGGSLVDQFRHGTLKIFTGSQPTHADDAESGSVLIPITQGSAAFSGGSDANGINLGQIADCELHKALGDVWSGVATATGTAGYFRLYGNDATAGASTVEPRVDGAIATSGSQMNMANTAVTSGGTTTIDSVDIPMAESV